MLQLSQQIDLTTQPKTLWMGNIEQWMDENFIAQVFATSKALVSSKVIRDKTTGLPSGYGFLEFIDHQSAKYILDNWTGQPMPNTSKVFQLRWGIHGGGNKGVMIPTNNAAGAAAPTGQTLSLYVGDLDPSITDLILLQFYNQMYQSAISAKVIIDSLTGLSKGYGFVTFTDADEGRRAQVETNGKLLKGRHIKTNQAVQKPGDTGLVSQQANQYQSMYKRQQQHTSQITPQVQVQAHQPMARSYNTESFTKVNLLGETPVIATQQAAAAVVPQQQYQAYPQQQYTQQQQQVPQSNATPQQQQPAQQYPQQQQQYNNHHQQHAPHHHQNSYQQYNNHSHNGHYQNQYQNRHYNNHYQQYGGHQGGRYPPYNQGWQQQRFQDPVMEGSVDFNIMKIQDNVQRIME